jgi:hypothetical protein
MFRQRSSKIAYILQTALAQACLFIIDFRLCLDESFLASVRV